MSVDLEKELHVKQFLFVRRIREKADFIST